MGKYGNGILVSDGNGNKVIEIEGNWYKKIYFCTSVIHVSQETQLVAAGR